MSGPFDSARIGLHGSACYRGKDGFGRHRWQVRVHVGRRRYAVRTMFGSSVRELSRNWRAFLEDLETGLAPDAGRRTFGDFVRETWLPHVRRYREAST